MPMMPVGEGSKLGLSANEISSAWNLPPILSTLVPTTGTIHQTLLLSTNAADYAYVLRAYRYTQPERSRMVSEHALASYVKDHGLPAIAPVPLPSGETILEHAGRFYALYPFAKGQQISREQASSPEIVAAMGTCLGTLHQILAAYPAEMVHSRTFGVDLSETVATIDALEVVISENIACDAFDQQILTTLRQRRDWLLSAEVVDLRPFEALERQVLHGDYQETNLFFQDSQVSAIIDWDQAYVAPRSWELIRTLHYVFHLDGPRCQLFLKAYRAIFPLAFDELDTTAKAYGWLQAHNLWLYTTYYLEQNRRVRSLFLPNFRPFAESWAEIAEALC